MIKVLWIDDEIDFFNSHIIFLEKRGFQINKALSGNDGLLFLKKNRVDIILIDQNMPGLAGTETIKILKENFDSIPVIMISQNTDENVIDNALGQQVKDYLLKPVNPNQILLSLKKIFSNKDLIKSKTVENYQKKYQEINNEILECISFEDWQLLYKKIVKWEILLSEIDDIEVVEILLSQKNYANNIFCSFVEKNYENALGDPSFVTSINIFKKHVFPHLNCNESTLFILIDNFRFDQWKIIEPFISDHYNVEDELLYSSILPTTTQYSRNSIFSGLSPLEIMKQYPNYWSNEFDSLNKNKFENELLTEQLKRLGLNIKHKYLKLFESKHSKSFNNNISNLNKFNLTTIIYNFMDLISHAKKDVRFIKEIANSDKAYRDLTLTWFKNSQLLETIKKSSELGYKIILTSDHGMINVFKPSKISGSKNISSNMRYKTSDQILAEPKDVIEFKNPKKIKLPSYSINSSFVFARSNSFFVYPNNYNEYVSMYKNTYQHGGVSMQEMFVPFLVMNPKL